MVTPEEACVTEATAAAQARLKQRGIVMNESFGCVVPEKLRMAA